MEGLDMSIEKMSDENLQKVPGGITYERLKLFSVMTEDENGKDVVVKEVSEIEPDKHYWLNPHSGRPGDWTVLGYGRDGEPEKFLRALNGEATLTLEDVAMLSENYHDLV